MKITEWQKKRTFGPVVEHMPDGTFRPYCTWCAFLVGSTCTHVEPSRLMPDPENTPEWCEMRESMIHDAKNMLEDQAPLDRVGTEDEQIADAQRRK